MTETYRHKQAVVLSGGGANGAFEVGVMQALFSGLSPATGYAPLNPDIILGTSVGAYNGAILMAQLESGDPATAAGYLEHIWLNRVADNPPQCGNGVYRFRGDPLDFFNLECLISHPLSPFAQLLEDSVFLAQDWFRRGANFVQSKGSLEYRMLALFSLSSFISTEPLRQLVRETLQLERIRQSDKVLKIITTQWKTGTLRIFEKPDMTDEIGEMAILASSAIPGFFPPIEVAGELYVDGGVIMNTPLKPAIDAGADIIHVVYLDPDVQNIPLQRLQNTLDTLDRMLTIQFALKLNEDIETVVWINRGLDVIERAARGDMLSDADARDFIRVVGQFERRSREASPYRKIAIHRYHPHEDLGGLLGILNFDHNRISDLIEQGRKNAIAHDCRSSACILV